MGGPWRCLFGGKCCIQSFIASKGYCPDDVGEERGERKKIENGARAIPYILISTNERSKQ